MIFLRKVPEKENSRLSWLIWILTQLQSKRLLTSRDFARKFDVSIRTIYRDIKILEQACIPIAKEKGKGYTLLPEYKIKPLMFTEDELNALITTEKL